MLQVLIVEDIPETQNWIAKGLDLAFPDVIAHPVSSISESYLLLDQSRFDFALIDIQLPDGSGIELISQISQRYPDTRCIVVSIYDDDHHVFPALQSGACGYLLKDMSVEDFARRLRGIVEDEPPLSPAIARRLLKYFAKSQPEQLHNLTPREKEVLLLISKGVKLSAVAECLQISRHTAADHVKSIYRKLNISSRAEATIEAARLGLIHPS